MEQTNISAARFAEEYEKTSEKVGHALREYLGNPDVENTRSLRASVRRLSTALDIIPKRSRKKEMRLVRRRCRKLLKATSKIRDVDIVDQKLAKTSAGSTIELLMNNLREERDEYSSDSMKDAWRLFEIGMPKVDRKDFRGARRWVAKTLDELDRKVMEVLPVVTKNEGKVEELHSLRKHAKTIRYAIELLPATRSSAVAVEALRSWQDILGEVRDSDVLIEYLGRARQTGPVKQALASERDSRHARYVAFVRSSSKDVPAGKSILGLAGIGRDHLR
jgi:CHAD domain-containing protein